MSETIIQGIIGVVPAIISVIGLLWANYHERNQHRLFEIYTIFIYPIHTLLTSHHADIPGSIHELNFDGLKAELCDIVDNISQPCPVKLYRETHKLSLDTLKAYFDFIEENYRACHSDLEASLPYNLIGPEVKRMKKIRFGSKIGLGTSVFPLLMAWYFRSAILAIVGAAIFGIAGLFWLFTSIALRKL